MIEIYEYGDYKSYVNEWIATRPKGGRGELGRMAKSLGVHPTMTSHIFRGDLDISLELAAALAQYIGLSTQERNYFLDLVQLSRAGTEGLRNIIREKITQQQDQASSLKFRMPSRKEKLRPQEIAKYYSSWHFMAIQYLCSIEPRTPSEISELLGLHIGTIHEAIDFLCKIGVSEVTSQGVLSQSVLSHLPSTSPMVWKHHTNWRLKAMDRHFQLDSDELIYTGPLTISKRDFSNFRKRLMGLLEELAGVIQETEPEMVGCINIDWVKI